MRHIIYLFLFLFFYSCGNRNVNENHEEYSNDSFESNNANDYNINSGTVESDDTYHTDPNYKYEYRTGNSGEYEYNYDISGLDQDGNTVYGNIDIEGKYGSGYIQDENGEEKYLDVEWVDYGVLEGTDEDGNSYELEVDE